MIAVGAPGSTPYPDIVGTSHATAAFFRAFFTAKTRRDIEATHAHFHPGKTVYFDATLGWALWTSADVRNMWEQYMPQWAAGAKSYPTRILGHMTGAVVFTTDTPELFGGEIRTISIADLQDGKIVRLVDYWDGRGFGAGLAGSLRVPADSYPHDLGVSTVTSRPGPIATQENKVMTASMPAPSTLVRPFTVAISDAEIEDLKQRLARTRWPNPETVPDWSQGVRLENAQSLISYWAREYDWRRFESELNRFPQFLTAIDGLDIHFIHVKSKNPNAMPLILTHGWPGSIVEFLKLIDPLTDPAAFGGNVEDSFDVVVPSLPGFGFSQKPTDTGWNVSRIATAWVELMKRLGYKNWAAQGGDWGAVVTTALGAMRPEGLLGIHLNTQYAFPAQIPDKLSDEERYAVDTLALYTGDLGGANHLQGTKPETVGIALADSPAGQAAWIYDKFQSKTDNHGLAEDALSTDDMLDAISLYWYTNSAASSGRIYWENKSASLAGPKLTLPVAVTVFPRDIPRLPRTWIEDTYTNLIHYGEADKGGHFAALEQPEILISEIRTGLRSLRS